MPPLSDEENPENEDADDESSTDSLPLAASHSKLKPEDELEVRRT